MKINEAFADLMQNRDEVYQADFGYQRCELSLSESGYFYLKIFDSLGCEIDPGLAGGGFNGNIRFDGEWEKVRVAVDFMTAVNSGKRITYDGWARYYLPSEVLGMIGYRAPETALGLINGKWYVE